jgi:hypothetical protein
VGADLEGVFVVGGEDGGGHAPFGFARVRIGLEVAVADVAAAGAAEEALGCGLGGVDVTRERPDYRGWRDKLGLDALGQGRVEAAEGAMGVAADGTVAEMDWQWESRGRDCHGEVGTLAVALRSERLVCRRELVREMKVGRHLVRWFVTMLRRER